MSEQRTLEQTLELARGVLRRWLSTQEHDKCWYYPTLFYELCRILRVTPDGPPTLPPREEFEYGCKVYQNELYDGCEAPGRDHVPCPVCAVPAKLDHGRWVCQGCGFDWSAPSAQG